MLLARDAQAPSLMPHRDRSIGVQFPFDKFNLYGGDEFSYKTAEVRASVRATTSTMASSSSNSLDGRDSMS